jgi:hypothetical protein
MRLPGSAVRVNLWSYVPQPHACSSRRKIALQTKGRHKSRSLICAGRQAPGAQPQLAAQTGKAAVRHRGLSRTSPRWHCPTRSLQAHQGPCTTWSEYESQRRREERNTGPCSKAVQAAGRSQPCLSPPAADPASLAPAASKAAAALAATFQQPGLPSFLKEM